MSDKEYLIKSLDDYKKLNKPPKISYRSIPSYFKFNFDQYGDNKIQIFTNYNGVISIRVSKNVINWEAYTLILIAYALILQKNYLLEPSTVIFDKDREKIENFELCKAFAKDLILGTDYLNNYEKKL